MKKTFLTFFFAITLLTPFTLFADVQYTVLAPIPGTVAEGNPTINEGYLSTYLNNLYMLGIALCTGLAVLMIVIGGIQWSGSGTWSGKTEGKERIQAALLGLLIALGSYVILNTINPDLLSTELNLGRNVNSPGLPTNPSQPGAPTNPSNPNQPTNPNQPGQPTTPTPGVPPGDTTGGIDGRPIAGEAQGRATHFGYNDSEDNGRGTPRLDPIRGGGGVNTNNATVMGVALPESVLERALGIPANASSWEAWAPARNAAVYVYDPSNPSKHVIVPIVDLGPGAGPISRGVVIDETHAVNQYFGGDGGRGYRIIPNYYNQ